MATTIYNGSVTLFKGVPFDPTYKNILSPHSVNEKFNILKGHYTYTTVNNIQMVDIDTTTGNGNIRLTVNAADAYDYNYMYISDVKHGLSFFAFINGCNYINDGPTDPTHAASGYQCVYEYSITKDIAMTHINALSQFFPATIIRHTSTDSFKDGRHPESVSPAMSAYNYRGINSMLGVTHPDDCLAVTMFSFNEITNYSELYNIPNACMAIIYKNAHDAVVDLHDRLSLIPGATVFGLYVIPKFMYALDPSDIPSTGYRLDDVSFTDIETVTMFTKSEVKGVVNTGCGTTIKNKKCYYFPFTKIKLIGNEGSVAELRPECFKGTNVQFSVKMSGLCPVSITVSPRSYQESNNAVIAPPAYLRCSSGTYPMGNGAIDSYAAYIGERYRIPNINIDTGYSNINAFLNGSLNSLTHGLEGTIFGSGTSIGSSALGTAANIGSASNRKKGAAAAMGMASRAGAAGMALQFVNAYGNEVMTMAAMGNAADPIVGSVPAPNVDYVGGNVDVKVQIESVTPEVMAALDDYFERYGYSQGGILATPDVDGRSRYVYVRTGSDCIKCDDCNSNELMLLNNIFMNGVTVWQSRAIVDGKLTYGNNGGDTIPDITEI